MSSQQKEIRKSLKGPDSYQEWFAHAVMWLEKNTKNIISVVVPLLVVVLIGIGWQ